jgi:hypothetical protein
MIRLPDDGWKKLNSFAFNIDYTDEKMNNVPHDADMKDNIKNVS